jgi:addiction module HigA family antidote
MDRLKMLKSVITTKRAARIPVATVGEILLEEFLKPMALSQNALARAIMVPPRRINEIVLGKRTVTADTDLRLARYFGMSDGFFLRLQMDYDLRMEKQALDKKLLAIKPRAA